MRYLSTYMSLTGPVDSDEGMLKRTKIKKKNHETHEVKQNSWIDFEI